MDRITVRQDLFADPQKNICLTAKNTTKENTPTIQTHRFEIYFKVTKPNVYESLPNFGRWYMPPEHCGPAHLSPPTNVQQLELYNMTLVAESATVAEACTPHTDVVVEQATEYATEPVTQVAENAAQAVGGKNGAQIIIGPNGTSIPFAIYKKMNWDSLSDCINVLLFLVFGPETLRTHSLNCISSHKLQLDPRKIADIVFCALRNTIS
uniref:Uncharacterized protein n=1 Tax=Bactrocera dorsalis TaxID=27457 RepID=A0A034VB28_BACDO